MVQNLGKVRLDPEYAHYAKDMRDEYVQLLLKMIWAPAATDRELVAEKLADAPGVLALTVRARFPAEKLAALRKERELLREAETRALMQAIANRQFEEWSKEQAKLAETVDALYREFKDEDTVGIIVRLKDEEPLNRWMAIQMAMRRWRNVDNFLVEMLDDPAPMVRHTAHQALVQFARGADHGPFGATPTRDQIRAAQKSWHAYIATQDAPK